MEVENKVLRLLSKEHTTRENELDEQIKGLDNRLKSINENGSVYTQKVAVQEQEHKQALNRTIKSITE